MNLSDTLTIYGAGTSEGARKAWDTRGRGRKSESSTATSQLPLESHEIPGFSANPKAYVEQENQNQYIQAVKRLQSGEKPLADETSGPWRVVVMPIKGLGAQKPNPFGLPHKGVVLVTKDGGGPAPQGFWMDWQERSWGLSDKQYSALPDSNRATLEAKEQLKWLSREPQQYTRDYEAFYGK